MTYAQPKPIDDDDCLPRIPAWISSTPGETLEEVSFLSGAALATLHQIIVRVDLPLLLLRERLALRAAEACVGFYGRMERAPDLRDEVHLLRPGERSGPAGTVFVQWRQAVARPISIPRLTKTLPANLAEAVPIWMERGRGCPIGQAAAMLEAGLAKFPREETAALIVADAVLARALGWTNVVPLLATGLRRGDLRKTGDALRRACHLAVVGSSRKAVQMVTDLSRRAARLNAVAPKLRAKNAARAVEMFLTRDALSPSGSLTELMSDRAARRLCDRLVALGAVRELTGRSTSRLYGL